jgi:L-cysteate sulfo-lyase
MSAGTVPRETVPTDPVLTNPMATALVTLGTWPTPLEPAPRLGRALGLGAGDLWVKRDDLTGLGGGGNKVRKLEWLCGAAVADGADTLITCGARQSNHARLTAAAGARLGLRVILVLAGTEDGPGSGNVVLDGLLGANVAWAGDVAHEELGAVALAIVDRLRAEGGRPFLIPYGGSSVLGAQGYVTCGHELLAQSPDLHTVVTAIGSGGTMAGLVHALGAPRVLGVDCGAASEPAAAVAELVSELSGVPPAAGELRIRTDQVGAGYSELTEPVMAALTLAARTEGLILDPIYTGRALAGLAREVEEGQIEAGRQTVLLHSGGLPGLFGHPVTVSRALSGLQDLPPS